MGAIIRIFPLLLFVVIAYNMVVFGTANLGGEEIRTVDGIVDMEAVLGGVIFQVGLVSGTWKFTWGTMFVMVSLFMLFIELVRATRTDSTSIVNHSVSLIVMIIALLEFVVVKGFNTSVFFYITVMALIDVVAGFTITITSARRDFGGTGLAV